MNEKLKFVLLATLIVGNSYSADDQPEKYSDVGTGNDELSDNWPDPSFGTGSVADLKKEEIKRENEKTKQIIEDTKRNFKSNKNIMSKNSENQYQKHLNIQRANNENGENQLFFIRNMENENNNLKKRKQELSMENENINEQITAQEKILEYWNHKLNGGTLPLE